MVNLALGSWRDMIWTQQILFIQFSKRNVPGLRWEMRAGEKDAGRL